MNLIKYKNPLKCKHKHVIEIGYYGDLPQITGTNNKFWDGFCNDCKEIVYGQTGERIVRWTINKDFAWASKFEMSQKRGLTK